MDIIVRHVQVLRHSKSAPPPPHPHPQHHGPEGKGEGEDADFGLHNVSVFLLGSIIIGAEPLRVEVAVLGSMAHRPNEPSSFRGGKASVEPCFGIGLSLSLTCQLTSEDIKQHYLPTYGSIHSSGAVQWESRWPSWAVRRPNEPSGFRGRKAILNHASALVSACH